MSGKKLSTLFTWRSAICDSTLPAVVRHVALTLSLHMSERGDSCFPSTKTLARESGRSRSTVCDAIAILEKTEWLRRENRPGRSTLYFALIPEEGARPPGTPDAFDVPALAGTGARIPDGPDRAGGHEVVSRASHNGVCTHGKCQSSPRCLYP